MRCRRAHLRSGEENALATSLIRTQGWGHTRGDPGGAQSCGRLDRECRQVGRPGGLAGHVPTRHSHH